jgi:hypothetical protein
VNKGILSQITRLASVYDMHNYHESADILDAILVRIAQSTGPFNMNIPMEGRMQKYDRYHEKELDGVERDREKHPRLRPTDFIDDGTTDQDAGKDEVAVDEENTRIKFKKPEDETIFEMDDKDPGKGGNMFRMHDKGTAGWGFITHAPDSAGMSGLDRFTWENKRGIYDNPSDKYKLLLPQT